MSLTPELVHDGDRDELRKMVRRFVADKLPLAQTRKAAESDAAFDRALWQQMASEVGLQGLAISEQHGGSGQGFVELCIVLEELGRQLAGGPFLATVLAARALELAGDSTYLPRIAHGELIATLQLDGEARALNGAEADVVVVVAPSGVYALDTVTREPASVLDLTRPQAALSYDLSGATQIGTADLREHVRALACIALANEMVGGAERAMEIAVTYAKERYQFGRQIASFQAIKHRAAEMLIELEQARSTALYAAWVADHDEADLQIAASLAKIRCGQAFTKIAGDAIQMLGGIGFTWEHDMHYYFKRAHSSALLLGDATTHRRRLTSALGLLGGAR